MNIIKYKNIFYIISGIIIIPGFVSLLMWGVPLGIDFTGGSRIELTSSSKVNANDVSKIVTSTNETLHSAQIEENSIILRTSPLEQKQKDNLIKELQKKDSEIKEKSFETVGPTVGGETKNKAILAVIIASIIITLFIAWAFRGVSRPVASWKFGVCAIIALLHDLLLILGIFSVLGKVFGVEVDALFITAILTIMGFSVHDTIVVFDRIRENLRKNTNLPFHEVVNNSILETFNRSLNTSITVVLVLSTLLLFGGKSIQWFILALLIGIISGTYSSIFNAAPMLVTWYEFDKKRSKR